MLVDLVIIFWASPRWQLLSFVRNLRNDHWQESSWDFSPQNRWQKHSPLSSPLVVWRLEAAETCNGDSVIVLSPFPKVSCGSCWNPTDVQFRGTLKKQQNIFIIRSATHKERNITKLSTIATNDNKRKRPNVLRDNALRIWSEKETAHLVSHRCAEARRKRIVHDKSTFFMLTTAKHRFLNHVQNNLDKKSFTRNEQDKPKLPVPEPMK